MIGVLGGTFDPIHYGHLRPAHQVHERLQLDELRFIPAALPPHRAPPIATPAQRLHMVTLGIREFPGFVVDDSEIRRGGVSYTVTTLESLRDDIGDEPMYFMLGSDAFQGLHTWHRWRQLFELAHLVVVQRPDVAAVSRRSLPEWARSQFTEDVDATRRRPAGGLLFVDVPPLDISATELRAAIARGETPATDVLPPKVWEYIRSEGLYRRRTR
jgi:nicotinate-nucleotide adenylyltransferase